MPLVLGEGSVLQALPELVRQVDGSDIDRVVSTVLTLTGGRAADGTVREAGPREASPRSSRS